MIKVLIADDHTMFLHGLKMLLSNNKKYEVVATAANGAEILQLLKELEVDVILMDINMPVLTGYEATLVLAKQHPDVKIVALSMLADSTSVMKMLEAGALGYIFKNADEAELFEAIDTVYDGEYYLAPSMQPMLKEYLKKKKEVARGYEKMDTHPLSAREIEILKHIMEGMTNQSIADLLYLSNRTVDTHRKNILAKLKLPNTAALVKYATEKAAFLGLDTHFSI